MVTTILFFHLFLYFSTSKRKQILCELETINFPSPEAGSVKDCQKKVGKKEEKKMIRARRWQIRKRKSMGKCSFGAWPAGPPNAAAGFSAHAKENPPPGLVFWQTLAARESKTAPLAIPNGAKFPFSSPFSFFLFGSGKRNEGKVGRLRSAECLFAAFRGPQMRRGPGIRQPQGSLFSWGWKSSTLTFSRPIIRMALPPAKDPFPPTIIFLCFAFLPCFFLLLRRFGVPPLSPKRHFPGWGLLKKCLGWLRARLFGGIFP